MKTVSIQKFTMFTLTGITLLCLFGAVPEVSRFQTVQPAHADNPKVLMQNNLQITGPDKVDAGKSAIVKLPRAEAGDNYTWLVAPEGISWIGGENRDEVFAILLDLDPGYYFVSFASPTSHAIKMITVEDTNPNPPAPPTPPTPPTPPGPPTPPVPPPAPVLPDGALGLIKSSNSWISTVEPGAQSLAKTLAGSFRSSASAIAAGTLTDAQSILAFTKAANNTALGAQAAAWKPWATKLQEALTKLNADNKLNVPADYQEAWTEIAQGLEAALPSP